MDKTERLLDAINDPEKYSSEEIKELLQDAEVKEIFDLLDKTKSSIQPIPTPDIDEEWNKFKYKNRNKRKTAILRIPAFHSWKIAASFIVAILSISAVAAIVGINVNSMKTKECITIEKEFPKSSDAVVSQEDSEKTPSDHFLQTFDTVIFDNEPLEVIMKQISDFYGYKIEFKNDKVKSLRLYFRWSQASNIQEIIESLNNFEQIHISKEDETIKID